MQRPAETRSKIARRRFPAALAALWVCLGLQPCALAATSDDDCPHGAGAAAHAMPPGHGDGHAHGQAPAAPDCDSAGGSCCDSESSATSGRTGALKADDGGEPDALPAPRGLQLTRRQTGPPERHDKPPLPPDPARPLHVLNCVYLD